MPSIDRSPTFPVIGLGASAGGLAAFKEFFSGIPANLPTGAAFVLVQHLDPDRKSLLTELIARVTTMEVSEVIDGMELQPDQVFIIPPRHGLQIEGNIFHLEKPDDLPHRRFPIDGFFRSLAQNRGALAVGAILSGHGNDGTQGAKDLKEHGGLVLAQSPETAEFDSMPRQVIVAGLADFIAAPRDLAVHFLESFGSLHRAESLQVLFAHLKAQTGHDFALYKPSTMIRRIDRRREALGIATLDEYVAYLLKTTGEPPLLFQDLLIGVTHFFRDPGAYEFLGGVAIPTIFETKPPGSVVRVWSTGCSTGEEAYSLAIILHEQLLKIGETLTVQIFATDLDGRAIETARSGWYPRAIADKVSEERLAKYFTVDPDGLGYRIQKNIRAMMVFSEHDVLKDPPFSKIDLLVCRNVLIYLRAELQKRLVPVFHYSLNPGGLLFLGPSESIGEFSDLFSTVDRKAKIFRREEQTKVSPRVSKDHFGPPPSTPSGTPLTLPGKPTSFVRQSLRELTERSILQRMTTVAVLVTARGDIAYFHGRTGRYLEPAPGVPGMNNLLKMAREGLRYELASMLRKVSETGIPEFQPGVLFHHSLPSSRVDLGVSQAATDIDTVDQQALFLVTFDESVPAETIPLAHPTDSRVVELQKELRAKEEFLQNANEELENYNDELRWSNEQAQAVNEELQSTNEELETSKEELQSVNEELTTVNAELQAKVSDLSRVNNDMNNLLAGNGIATVFVDLDLKILRFTPAATRVINLISSDVGRPVGHIISNLRNYHTLTDEVREVLETLVPRQTEVQSLEGDWFTLRIQPYRTLNNVIEGVVVSFIDINEVVRMREALAKAHSLVRLAVVVRDSHDAITVQDLDGRILAWNPGAVRMYGWTEAEALAMNVRDRIPESQREESVAKLLQLSHTDVLAPYQTQRLSKAGEIVPISLIAAGLLNEQGEVYAIATTERIGG